MSAYYSLTTIYNTITNYELKKELQEIIDTPGFSIEKDIALETLYRDDVKSFFSDLLNYGCVTGMVGSLIYFKDTHAFFDTHYYQIEEIREEWEDSIGEPIRINGDLKNTLAWFAFEEVAYKMANEFELEV